MSDPRIVSAVQEALDRARAMLVDLQGMHCAGDWRLQKQQERVTALEIAVAVLSAPRPGRELEAIADAIDAARYQHPTHPRERPRPFSEADESDREYALRLARAILALTPASETEWQDISTAPKDGTALLLWWPECKLDDDCNLTDEVVGGTIVIGNFVGSWQELGGLEGRGAWFGDDSEPGYDPTHWRPLPAPPASTQHIQQEGIDQ